MALIFQVPGHVEAISPGPKTLVVGKENPPRDVVRDRRTKVVRVYVPPAPPARALQVAGGHRATGRADSDAIVVVVGSAGVGDIGQNKNVVDAVVSRNPVYRAIGTE